MTRSYTASPTTYWPQRGGWVESNDIATIFGTDSTAFAGANATDPDNFDLAAVVGDGLNAHTAIGGDYLLDILPAL
jgi:hypothetical protein